MTVTDRMRGIENRLVGVPWWNCPYEQDSIQRQRWLVGWSDADEYLSLKGSHLPRDVSHSLVRATASCPPTPPDL